MPAAPAAGVREQGRLIDIAVSCCMRAFSVLAVAPLAFKEQGRLIDIAVSCCMRAFSVPVVAPLAFKEQGRLIDIAVSCWMRVLCELCATVPAANSKPTHPPYLADIFACKNTSGSSLLQSTD